jgi:hypothetical protein
MQKYKEETIYKSQCIFIRRTSSYFGKSKKLKVLKENNGQYR